MLRRLRVPLLSLLALMLLAGCSNPPPALMQRFGLRAASTSVNTAAPSTPANQLLVQGADGNIYLASPDGAQRFALTDDGSARRVYAQPTWSADGSQIAWSRIDRRGSALITSQFDGSDRREVSVPFAPFYIAWSPRGDQLAYLSNWTVVEEPSIALRLVDVSGGANQVQTLADGQPFYFAWAPDGEEIVTHIANERVERQAITGEQTSLVISGGAFQTPQWTPDGRSLVYALADTLQQYLVVTDLDGVVQQEITDFDGQITFAVSPDGMRLAYVPTPRATQANTLGPLYVVDLATQATRSITDRPVVAFAWSPDGQQLAYLTLEPLRNRVGMRWNVWDGSQRIALSTFSPTNTFLTNYLPFFDQYMQSHRIWSPASDALVYAGWMSDGRSGIWVQPVTEGEAPVYVGPGVMASWSPQ